MRFRNGWIGSAAKHPNNKYIHETMKIRISAGMMAWSTFFLSGYIWASQEDELRRAFDSELTSIEGSYDVLKHPKRIWIMEFDVIDNEAEARLTVNQHVIKKAHLLGDRLAMDLTAELCKRASYGKDPKINFDYKLLRGLEFEGPSGNISVLFDSTAKVIWFVNRNQAGSHDYSIESEKLKALLVKAQDSLK